MKAAQSTFILVLCVLALAASAAAQLLDPLDGQVLSAGETDCMKKLNWPACGGWDYDKQHPRANESDPDAKKYEAEVCTQDCQNMFKSLSDEYLKKICGPNYEFPRNRRQRLPVVAANGVSKCQKDEAGIFCFQLYENVSKKFNFNASALADELQKANPSSIIVRGDEDWKKVEAVVVPWSKYPKDYACSKCAQDDIDRLTKIKAFHKGGYHDPHTDISPKGLAERTAMCAGWVAPKTAATTAAAGTNPSSATRQASSATLVSSLMMAMVLPFLSL
ncbi:hypothetical protein BCR44DRAFT_27064 [Catenaria anguillulae PL171]|uniref:Uncharacterized protein n=1 Tax=Catenaria anguillulae PL171 TaxID=765915 RepID=A0A1Y2HT90_9FUNG|nr:hypothetical protein BCR44DRAFT_27064 [Catenaria anguillulae PL171]